jgi:predicted O-linked N-acetylglucosamine transferase (SPINDLY family)
MNRHHRRAAKLGPVNKREDINAMFLEAFQHHQAGRIYEAERLYRSILGRDPKHAHSWSLMGVLAEQTGHPEESLPFFDKAISINANVAAYHSGKGDALKKLMRQEEAADCFRRAIRIKPDFVEAMNNLGLSLVEIAEYDQAQDAYHRAIAWKPDFVEPINNLGNLLKDLGHIGLAITWYRRAEMIDPKRPVLHHNLGVAYSDLGQMAESDRHFECAVAISPDHAAGAAALVFSKLYQPGYGLRDIYDAAMAWGRKYTASPGSWNLPIGIPYPRQPNIGFVSGDFRVHAVGFLVLPAIEGLIARGHKIALYSNSDHQDEMTDRFRALATPWRHIAGMSDKDVRKLIIADGIDILIDLAGQTGYGRAMVFAKRAAPIQIAGWLGYPATSGIQAMDYVLADRYQIPDGTEQWWSEKVVRLPGNYICFDPMNNPMLANAPRPGPREPGTPIVFGSFNVLKKVTPAAIEAWCRVLHRVPGSKFIMKAGGLGCPVARAYFAGLFESHGIGLDRLTMIDRTPHADHLRAMLDVDIALDTFPYSGGQTTLELLWMGVPVITLPGETFASRHSMGYLSGIGQDLLIAANVDDYVDSAVALAESDFALPGLRGDLRSRLRVSSLCDTEQFAADLESALLRMWQRYCGGKPADGFDL